MTNRADSSFLPWPDRDLASPTSPHVPPGHLPLRYLGRPPWASPSRVVQILTRARSLRRPLLGLPKLCAPHAPIQELPGRLQGPAPQGLCLQGGQGSTGPQTCAPRPTPPSKMWSLRPRAPPPKWTSWVISRAATQPARNSRIAGCSAHTALAVRRRACRKFRDSRAAAASSAIAGPRPGSVNTVIASLQSP
jgi:hypothetical protein